MAWLAPAPDRGAAPRDRAATVERVRRRLAIALVLPALAGCGGDDPPRQAGPAPVYPPRAAEPATSP